MIERNITINVDTVEEFNKVLQECENAKKKRNCMRLKLSNKSLEELDNFELVKEISYLVGRRDYVVESSYIPNCEKDLELERVSNEIDMLSSRLLLSSMERFNETIKKN